MDAPIVLWEQWHEQVKQFFEEMHGHQKKGLALAVIGILLVGSAVLQRMAESVHLASISQAKMPSLERRFARFVANERIVVKSVWKQFLAQVLPYWQGKRIHLILDSTPCGEKASIVYLGLLAHVCVLQGKSVPVFTRKVCQEA